MPQHDQRKQQQQDQAQEQDTQQNILDNAHLQKLGDQAKAALEAAQPAVSSFMDSLGDATTSLHEALPGYQKSELQRMSTSDVTNVISDRVLNGGPIQQGLEPMQYRVQGAAEIANQYAQANGLSNAELHTLVNQINNQLSGGADMWNNDHFDVQFSVDNSTNTIEATSRSTKVPSF